MAQTNLIVEITSENPIEEATCRIENEDFPLSRTPNNNWAGQHTIDVVGLTEYSAVIRSDTGALWTLSISKASGGDPFVKKSHVVPNGTSMDTMSGTAPLP